MTSLLLIIIYVSFVSLGLPDAILGAAWPFMYPILGVEVSAAGIITFLIAGCTIVSSLACNRLLRLLGTGKLTACSVALTALALLGFSFSRSFPALCIWAIPYGLGAGSVDAALNNYVALHYSSRHMSWLHCFWGLGASLGPGIMGAFLASGGSWTGGYRSIGLLQLLLTAVLLISLPMWKRSSAEDARTEGSGASLLRRRGVKTIMAAMLCYCAMESSAGLWASSWLVLARGFDADRASRWASLFYLGITGGRFRGGFITDRLGDKKMVRLGVLIALLGGLLLLTGSEAAAMAGLLLLGLGCAPIYPSLVHTTPRLFGERDSQTIIGFQMASAYVGSTVMPPLFGLLTRALSLRLYPFWLLLFAALTARMAALLSRSEAKT